MTRLFVAGLFAMTAAPVAAHAQRVRDFEDSWFWGAKGGVTTFSKDYDNSGAAATYGLEWLITRTRGALYVSLDQADVNATGFVFDPSADGSIRGVQVEKLRRVGFAALAFPKRFGRFRPYGGAGLTIELLSHAYPLIAPSESDVSDDVYDRIDSRKSAAGFLLMGGTQAQFGKAALFAQASMVPANSRFLLRDALGFFEAGVLYNFGSSREGIK
jgi:hypothetical protein